MRDAAAGVDEGGGELELELEGEVAFEPGELPRCSRLLRAQLTPPTETLAGAPSPDQTSTVSPIPSGLAPGCRCIHQLPTRPFTFEYAVGVVTFRFHVRIARR